MNRHERRRQAKLGHDDERDAQQLQIGLETQARNYGFPSVEALREAHFLAAKAIVDRLAQNPTLSIGDCYVFAASAFATAGGPATRTHSAELFMSLDPFIQKPCRPNESEQRQILTYVRRYLEAVEARGGWSLEGVGALSIVDGPHDADLSAASLNPAVEVTRVTTCCVCQQPFKKGEMICSTPYEHAPAGWTSVDVHEACVSMLKPQGTA